MFAKVNPHQKVDYLAFLAPLFLLVFNDHSWNTPPIPLIKGGGGGGGVGPSKN